MRVEPADGDSGAADAQAHQGFVPQFDGARHARRIKLAGPPRGDVSGDVDDAQALAGKQHPGFGGAGERRDVLGVPGEFFAAQRRRVLVHRRGNHRLSFTGKAHRDGLPHIGEGGPAASSASGSPEPPALVATGEPSSGPPASRPQGIPVRISDPSRTPCTESALSTTAAASATATAGSRGRSSSNVSNRSRGISSTSRSPYRRSRVGRWIASCWPRRRNQPPSTVRPMAGKAGPSTASR